MTRTFVMDEPDTRNRLDHMAQGVIGKPLDRPDGAAKVTGTATYAAEYKIDGCLEGVLVTATVAKGDVTGIDESSVLEIPGVVAVLHDPRMTVRSAQGGAGKAPKPQPAEHCAFAGLGTPLLPELPFALAVVLAAVSIVLLPGTQAPVLVARTRLRPPLRGPPIN